MSKVSQNTLPTTESSLTQDQKIARLVRNYPESLYRGLFNTISAKTIKFSPENLGRGKSCSRFLFEIGEECRHVRIIDEWTIDLTKTTINLALFSAGIIDGIAFANGNNYLVWAFLDQYMQFAGIGVTKKPYSAFSAGTGNKGASSRSFTVTNAYQFTIGARVCVRNTNGTAPQYEWNWATITSITNSTHIVLTMDNEAYSSNITSATGGEILQWDSFQPYIVSSTKQELYKPYYMLLGELYTDTSSGYIIRSYKSNDSFRAMTDTVVYNSTAAVNDIPIYLGRWLPLWSNLVKFYGYVTSTATGHFLRLRTIDIGSATSLFLMTQGNGIALYQNPGWSEIENNLLVYVYNNCATTVSVRVSGYCIHGGMRI